MSAGCATTASYDVLQDRPLDQKDHEAGVISDQIVEIGLSKKPEQRADHPTRLICINCTPHQKRGKGKRRGVGQTGPTSDGTLAHRHRLARRSGPRDRIPV